MDSHSRNTHSKTLMLMLPVALALVLTSCLTAIAADSRNDIPRVAAGYGKPEVIVDQTTQKLKYAQSDLNNRTEVPSAKSEVITYQTMEKLKKAAYAGNV